ncbi:TonB-dependent receptor [Paraurantiacibacter namhicola]|uniref:Colicin I receptor n=1 Tax=Paraurantiacibacter namhicola TaxID=645517 RepID=A0A1C7D4I0_9SPHN|nr:TonB-dependent receptor [Paraurantiacibacter namhicola]ANU06376.1 Colicin I receptor precursor [Paraurantiacibacter namhicola]
MKRMFRSALLVATLLTPATAFAQAGGAPLPQDETTEAESEFGLNEIVVTARRTDESINDAPVAVTAFDSETLNNRGLTDISDIGAQTPGLSFSSAFGRDTDRPVIRGLGNVLAGVQFGVESGVAIFIDGVLFRGDVQSLNFDALERVEIVKGSQSALYGRNTYSGAINFITKTPGNRFSGVVRGRVAEYDERMVSASIDIPIVEDVFAVRLDGRYYEYGGQYRNTLTGNLVGQEESTNIAATLYVTPSDDVSWRTRISYEEQDDGTPALFLQGADANNCKPGFRSAAFRGASFIFPYWPVTRTSTNDNQYYCGVIRPGPIALNNEPTSVPFRPSANAPVGTATLDGTAIDGYYRSRWYASSVIDIGLLDTGWTVSGLFGYRNELARTGTDSDHSDAFVYFATRFGPPPNPAVTEPAFANTHRSRAEDWSAEVRVSSPEYNPVRVLAGAYLYEFTLEDREVDFSNAPDGVPFGGPGSYKETIDNFSMYGRVEFDASDTITVGIEGRLLSERKTRTEYSATGSTFYAGDRITDFVPRVTVDWQPTPDTLLYAIYTEGNKPGGTNASAGAGIGRPTYASETLRGGEIGLKQTFLDGRAQFNVAAFYNEIDNVQLTTALPVGGGALTSVATNQGNAEVKGFEAEISFRPVRSLTLNAGVAYNDARFTSGCDDFQYTLNSGGLRISDAENPTAAEAPLCSIEGNRLPLGSPWQANAAIDFRQPFGDGNEFFVNFNGSYEASKFVQVHNLAETGKTYLLNGRVGAQFGQIEVAVFGRNLTNEDTIPLATRWFDLRHGIGTTGIPGGTNADTSFPRAFFGALRKGRTFGAEVSFRF